jgi:hypothetical protein
MSTSKMAPPKKNWTIEERMTLHHLFALMTYRVNDADWFRIYEQLHDTARGETTIYEDWRFGGLKKRGKMWKDQIRREVVDYTPEQHRAFLQSRVDIDGVVARLNITIPNRPVAHNAHTANGAVLTAAGTASAGPPTNNQPAAATTSTIATALGSSTSITQQVQTGEAASSSTGHEATVDVAASQPSPAAETPAIEPQRQSNAAGKRRQNVTLDIDSDSDSADGLFSISDVLKKGRSKQQAKDDKETQDAGVSSEMLQRLQRYGHTKADTANEKVRKREDKKGAEKKSSARKVYQEPDDSVVYIHNYVQENDPEGTTNDNDAGEGNDPEHSQPRDQPFDGDEEWTLCNPRYIAWRQALLFQILEGDVVNKFPHPVDPDATPEPEIAPLEMGLRMFNFFKTMFEDNVTEIAAVLDAASEDPTPGKKVWWIYNHLTKTYGLQPKFKLCEVFSSPLSPFYNFSLATQAWGRGLPMLHRSDIVFSGIGATTVVVCAWRNPKFVARTRTAADVSLIDREDPIFKCGGRVYRAEIHQPNMTAVLGPHREFSTAYIPFDTMLCDAEACPKCASDETLDTSPTSSLPRVHFRHLDPDKNFVQTDPYLYGQQNEDTGGEFPEDAPFRPDDIKFSDGFTQKVITCRGGACAVCQEATRMKNDSRPGMAAYKLKLFQEGIDRKEAIKIAAQEARDARAAKAALARARGRGRRGGRA